MPTSNALFCARALVDELTRAGVRTVCVAPGSRSTSLALAVAERGDLVSHVMTDERSMGFFALGIARASRTAVALVCTSGTAAANLLPAAIEASLGGGALLLLTADRPPELRDCSAPQTIDQVGLFGSHVRWATDVPILDASPDAARVLRSLASRAAALAIEGEGGPVHLNVPFREPFLDDSFPARERFAVAARDDGRPFTAVVHGQSLPAREAQELAQRLGSARRGVIVCAGRELPPADIAALAKSLGWPILADPLSGLRLGSHDRTSVVDAIEPLLRDEALRGELRPDMVLRFGLTPAPRSIQRWLDESWPAEHVVVDPSPWPDPVRAATTIVRADAGALCRTLCRALESSRTGANAAVEAWRDRWLAISGAARLSLEQSLESERTLFDAQVIRSLVRALPDGATLVVGNSMPIRDADAFLAGSDRTLRVMANRGASGIDGVLSTALGVAAASAGPTALVLGDLSFLHDCAALAFAAREHIPLLIVVVNNDGGGIFSYLPLRDALDNPSGADATGVAGDVFERFFGTPHGTDLKRVAAIGAGYFARVTESADLDATMAAALDASASGPAVVEVRTTREAARVAHQSIVRSAQAAAAVTVAAMAAAGIAAAGTIAVDTIESDDHKATPSRRTA